ncbi:hypothetical protein, partial [Acaryochloris sp. IP29b_bin.148]|uniref:hypothetical protein n=1 Tax=Acaryochloris sp. IP29b_bin.148 TaxID=2969218 RepID=UPI002610976F
MKKLTNILPFAQPGSDEAYELVRTENNFNCIEARNYVTEMWHRLDEMLDPDFVQNLGEGYYQRVWELYLGVSLLESRCKLENKNASEGPDFKVVKPHHIWVEAIAPNQGSSSDAIPKKQPGAHPVPDEKIKLRITSAFWEKCKKFDHYREKGIVGPHDACVIAINGCRIPSALKERSDLPRVVRAFFPFGYETIYYDRETLSILKTDHQYQAEISRQAGDNIPMTLFQKGPQVSSISAISAVIYTWADDLNHPNVGQPDLSRSGCDFMVVHNPLAS